MDWGLVIGAVSLFVNIITVGGTVLYAVHKVSVTAKTTTNTVATEVHHLTTAVTELKDWLSRVDDKSDDHERRISRIEGKVGIND